MAVEQSRYAPITAFDDWYKERAENERTGMLEYRGLTEAAEHLYRRFLRYKSEMDARVAGYENLVKLAANEVISRKPDLPNISSGETAGLIRRVARNVVQHTPNVEIISKFDDESAEGVIANFILREKIIGSDTYSNDMQQNLFASAVSALTLGFDCVIPVLTESPSRGWYVQYDTIHYRDVFPEPGAKDIRRAHNVFIRRWLTKEDIHSLIRNQVSGWDIAALKRLLSTNMPSRDHNSVAHEDKKHHTIPEGYEIITWYSDSGDPFLTFSGSEKILLRIEKNKHPWKQHPVFFMILEVDPNQPLGKSQVEMLLGRQEFQDLMLNGAMKLWYRNINPSIIGYGTINALPNLSPGKFTPISNPNARIEAFEVNTQTLLQYGTISQQNLGSMVNLIGSADQQMATQAGSGMSATPQGVNAQQELVDITTNNYQKAIESFFSHYCSYALMLYFHELSSVQAITPSADARRKLINAAPLQDMFDEKGTLHIKFSELATEYYVRCVPGSLVELEDEKQLRILNELFVPLSQALPAIAQAQNPEMLANAAATMQFIVQKEIALSGSNFSTELNEILRNGVTPQLTQYQEKADAIESRVTEIDTAVEEQLTASTDVIKQLQEQISLLAQTQQLLLEKLGVQQGASTEQPNSYAQGVGNSGSAPGNI